MMGVPVGEMACPYCGKPAELVSGDRLYPHRKDLAGKMEGLKFWLCSRCDAYVGCHRANAAYGMDGTEPLGTMADEELRLLRVRLHNLFDPMWRGGGMTRTQAYARMSSLLGVPAERCHVGMFDKETCRRALEALDKGRAHER